MKTEMGLVDKGDYDKTPQIPEDYYMAKLDDIKTYDRDDAEALGMVINFEIDTSDADTEEDSVVLPFFAPAKLSHSSKRESSKLGENLYRIGILKPLLKEMDIDLNLIIDGKKKWVAKNEEESEDLKQILKSIFLDKEIRVNVEDDQSGESSQVSKLSKIFEGDSK